MEILNISAECFPVAKVGGLADVVGALPKYLNNLGVSTKVIIPYYANAYTKKKKFDVERLTIVRDLSFLEKNNVLKKQGKEKLF